MLREFISGAGRFPRAASFSKSNDKHLASPFRHNLPVSSLSPAIFECFFLNWESHFRC